MSKTRGRPLEKDRIKRSELLELAFREFSENDFNSVSIRKLAASIGVSDSLFIHHFGSKQKLWYEVVDILIEREFKLLIEQQQTETQQNDPLTLLRNGIAELLRLAKQRPAMFRLFFRELNDDNERAEYLKKRYLQPYLRLFDFAIDQCVEQKLLKPISSASLHTVLLGCINILINPSVLQPGVSDEQRHGRKDIPVDELVDIIFNGATQKLAV